MKKNTPSLVTFTFRVSGDRVGKGADCVTSHAIITFNTGDVHLERLEIKESALVSGLNVTI